MPSTTDGARNDCHWVCGYEEGHGEVGAETCILHSHFDTDGAFLRCVEMEETTDGVAEDVAYGVVAKYHCEGETEEKDAVLLKWVVNRGDHSSYDASKADDRNARHTSLNLLEHIFMSQPKIETETYCDRNDGHDKYLLKHTHCIYIDFCPCKPKDEKRSHDRGEEGRGTCHSD